VTRAAEALAGSGPVALARAALGREHWIVGGTVRDALLRRPLVDLDLVVRDDARGAARALAAAAGGHPFELSEEFGGWRVVMPDRTWQADVTPLRADTIEGDLALRDFTVNAIAIAAGQAELIDPHRGAADLDANVLRAVADGAFRDDPLRTMRMARLAAELALDPDEHTRALARGQAQALARVSPERSFYELRRLVVSPDPLGGLRLMDEAGLVAVLLPELEALKDVEQNPYHHLDVWGHTLEVLEQLLAIERDPEPVFGGHAEGVAAELARPLADELTRGQALRFGALMHDVGKPATRAVTAEGRVLFWGHDELGARMSSEACRRLRASAALGDFLAGLARHHLRLGFLVHHRPLSRRDVYRYLRTCEPVELEVTVLTAADRLATRGERTRQEAIDDHVALVRDLAGEALAWRAKRPRPPVSGDELMAALGLGPGPEVGRLLEELREAAYAGEVGSREEAIELARDRLGEGS
jgi:putative nucleotidyltransferase with HDIG domain